MYPNTRASAIQLLTTYLMLQSTLQNIPGPKPGTYDFTSTDIWLTMPDGIRLSALLAIPVGKSSSDRFPVLLEYKPYRKNDGMYNFEYPAIFYLVRRGYIVS